MEEESVFGLRPEQLDRLLSLGTDEELAEIEKHDADVPGVGGNMAFGDERGLDEKAQSSEATASLSAMVEQPGGWIGRYKLLSVLGEGGMGIVYLAEQEHPIRRKVALKVIKPGLDSKRVMARFESERQALALLDHPNIAHVYEAGTTQTGRPYFVMEYVQGISITDYCDRHKLTIEKRLRLFQQVCQAVQHAHQKGIIHRDIKPSNILVSAENDKAITKIIDFGVAKAMTQPLTERTHRTEECQLLGTPEYMSPEQADMATEDIDTRSDVYSLGVLLYVLLTGVLPFDPRTLRDSGIENIRKTIRETDPKTPSTRLTELGVEAKKIAESRQTEIGTLAKHLRKELEWIPLKAMRKKQAERYRSASELADDIQNYLKGNPLIAGPESTVYLIKKFVERKRALVTGIAAILIVLIAGIVISTILAIGQARARAKAQRIAYASDMSLAQQSLEMNDMGRARQLLETHRPALGEVDLRGWEWRYLWQQCRSDALGELCHYPPRTYSVAYSPNGRALALAGSPRGEGFVDIWDVPARKRIATLQPKEGSCVTFSPRGNLVATNAGNHIRLWQTGTWDQVGQLPLAGGVVVVKFSPDGTRLASLSFSDEDGFTGELTVWDVHERAIVRQIGGMKLGGGPLSDLDFSPGGNALVIGEAFGRLRVIDLATGDTIFDRSEAHPAHIVCLAWSPNGSIIASGSGWEGAPIHLRDAASGEVLGELEGHTSWVSDLVFSEDGLRLYSACGDQTIRIWDVGQQRCLATLRGSTHEVVGLALSPDGTTLASACKDGVVAFWSSAPQPQEEMPRLVRLINHAPPVFAPDSRSLAVSQEGTVCLLDLTASHEPEQVHDLGTTVSAIAYSPDGTLLVSGSEDGTIRVWSCSERRPPLQLEVHKAEILLLRFRADGTRLFSLDTKGKAIWWDALTWQADRTFVMERPLREGPSGPPVDVSLDGRLLAFSTETDVMHWLNAETGKLLKTTSGGGGTIQVAFSGDGLRLARTSGHGTVALWDPSSFTWVTSFRAHLMAAHGVAFSPDDRRLATGGATSRDAVRLWDLSTCRELLTLPGQCAVSAFVAFSNDGRWLAACGRGGELNLWHAPSWEEIEAEEKRLESGQSP